MDNGSKPAVFTVDEIFCTTKPSEKVDLSLSDIFAQPKSTSKEGALSLSDIFAQPQSDAYAKPSTLKLSDIFAAKDDATTTATTTTADTSPYTTSDTTTTSLTSPQTVAKVNNSTSSSPTQEFDDINFSAGGEYDDEEVSINIDEPPCKKIRPSINEKDKCILENFDDHNQAHKTNTKISSSGSAAISEQNNSPDGSNSTDGDKQNNTINHHQDTYTKNDTTYQSQDEQSITTTRPRRTTAGQKPVKLHDYDMSYDESNVNSILSEDNASSLHLRYADGDAQDNHIIGATKNDTEKQQLNAWQKSQVDAINESLHGLKQRNDFVWCYKRNDYVCNTTQSDEQIDLLSTTTLETIVFTKEEGQEDQLGIKLTEYNGGRFVFIDEVMPESQAEKNGIRAGDIPVYNDTMSSIISSGVCPIPYETFLQRANDKRVFTFNVYRLSETGLILPTVHVPSNSNRTMAGLNAMMERTKQSQQSLEDWDRRNGLPKSHCMTMVNSSRSRQQLQTGTILKKWTGAPSIKKKAGTAKKKKVDTAKKKKVDSAKNKKVDTAKKKKVDSAKKKKVDKAVILGIAKKRKKNRVDNVCPGYAVVGNTELNIGLAEGEHLPCYNDAVSGAQGRGYVSRLCDSCYRRSINDLPVYSKEYQLFRMLLKLRHPLILRRRLNTQLGIMVPDYSCEYKGHPIRIDQDELGHQTYDVEKELLGLERRMTPGANGESALVIRNNPDNSTQLSSRFQDPRQAVLIGALINKYKEYVDMGHECIKKPMVIYNDYRDEKEYSKHLRIRTTGNTGWTVKTSPHLTSARKKLNKDGEYPVVHSVHSRDPSDARDGNGKDIPHCVEEAIKKVFLAKQADPKLVVEV